MSEPIHLFETRIAPDLLTEWQKDKGLSPLTEARDLTYHRILTETWGDLVPRVFRVMPNDTLYGYSRVCAEELQAVANENATPLEYAALGVARIRSKPMPESWNKDRLFNFSIKVVPTMRQRDLQNRSHELDWYQYQGRSSFTDRETAYHKWLKQRVAHHDAMELLEVQITDFYKHLTIWKARQRPISKPVACLQGVLKVNDSARFNELLMQGVGRHKAYGYGMFLLSAHKGAV